jgi:thiol-disulfide isomerase/thioredoxin
MELCRDHATLVAVTSKNCGHCRAMQPALEALKSHDVDNQFQKKYDVEQLEANEDRDLVNQFQVRGYPSLFVYEPKNDTFYEYTNDRTVLQ